MGLVDEILEAQATQPTIDERAWTECLAACRDAAQACLACADACLTDESAWKLAPVARICQDAADVCEVTARLLSRLWSQDRVVRHAQLEACAVATRECARELEHRLEQLHTCRITRDACLRATRACDQARILLEV